MAAPEWLGLLKWSLAHAEEGRMPKPMSEEDKEWLTSVMKATVRDHAKALTDAFESLVDYNRSEAGAEAEEGGEATEATERILFILDDLEDVVCQVDMAQAFVKIGGPGCLLELVASPDPTKPEEPRCAAALVIATLCQNNPPAQEGFLRAGALKLLRSIVSGATAAQPQAAPQLSSEKLRTKCLGALSALVRGLPEAEAQLCGGGGGGGGGGAVAVGGGAGEGGGEGDEKEAAAGQQSRAMWGVLAALAEPTASAVTPLQRKLIFLMKALIGPAETGDEPEQQERKEQQRGRLLYFLPYLPPVANSLLFEDDTEGDTSSTSEEEGRVMLAIERLDARESALQLLLACARVDGSVVRDGLQGGGGGGGGGGGLKEEYKGVGAVMEQARSKRLSILNRLVGEGDEQARDNARVELSLWKAWDSAISTSSSRSSV